MSGFKPTGKVFHHQVFVMSDDANPIKVFPKDAVIKSIEAEMGKLKNFFIYLAENGQLRLSKTVASACAFYIKRRVKDGFFNSYVTKLSASTIKHKKHDTVGVDTLHLLNSINHFQTRARGANDSKRTGWVVGVQASKVGQSPRNKVRFEGNTFEKDPWKKKKKTETRHFSDPGGYYKSSKEITPISKLFLLENGRGPITKRTYQKKDRQGNPIKRVVYQINTAAQPPRPIFTMAVNEFLHDYGFVTMGGFDKTVAKSRKATSVAAKPKRVTVRKGSKAEAAVKSAFQSEIDRLAYIKKRLGNR